MFEIGSLLFTAYSAYSQNKAGDIQDEAADSAMDVAKKNAQRIGAETDETIRRTSKEQQQIQGETKSKIAASGFEPTGSMQLYFAEMMKNHNDEVAWIRKSGDTQREAAILEGKNAAKSAKAGAKATKAGAFGTVAQGLGQAYQWWG